MCTEGRCPFGRLVLTAPMIALHRLPEPRYARWLAEALDAAGLGGDYMRRVPADGSPIVSDRSWTTS